MSTTLPSTAQDITDRLDALFEDEADNVISFPTQSLTIDCRSPESIRDQISAGGDFRLTDAAGNRLAVVLEIPVEDTGNTPTVWATWARESNLVRAVTVQDSDDIAVRVLLPFATPLPDAEALEIASRQVEPFGGAGFETRVDPSPVLTVDPAAEIAVSDGDDCEAVDEQDRRLRAMPRPASAREAAAEGWTIAPFDADGDPDLSHDELALDLGRAGWSSDARYCAPLGGWLLWRGQHWEPEPGMKPMAMVRGFVRNKARLLVEWAERRATTLEPAAGEKLVAWAKSQAKTLRQDASIAAVERLARSNVKALAVPDQWDADDFLLGTPGGTVDLRTGELREATRGDYITRLTSIAPAERGTRPEAWLRFLGEVFPGDPEMVTFMQRLAGYALTGSTREHRFFVCHGSGRNGKGTLLGTLQAIMGDYAKGIPTATLLEARSPQHASPLARLRGARFVRGAELPVGQVWDEGLVKQLTGGDSITANLMRQDAFDFVPKFTLIVDGNTKPRIRTTDVAMRSRMTLIPFTASFAGREDRELPDRLKGEAGAILRWAIDGAVAWQRDGLRIPASVDRASRDYLDSEDSLAHFLEDETVAAPGNRVTAAALYSRYRGWAAEQGVAAATARAFGGMLSERGIERYRDMTSRGFVGLRLRDAFADEL